MIVEKKGEKSEGGDEIVELRKIVELRDVRKI